MDEGSLRLVREFVNTYDLDNDTEELPTPDDLAQWLLRNGLPSPTALSTADLDRALELREAIRDLLAGSAPRAAEILTAAARRAKLRPEFTPSGSTHLVVDTSGVDGALGTLLVRIHDAMTDGRWRRLKLCHNDACRWAFYDASRAGAGKWCSMAVCGNRNKAAAWRARQRRT